MSSLNTLRAAILLTAALLLSNCQKPPLSAYDNPAATSASAGTPIGNNTAGESCDSQPTQDGTDVYCGAWDQPSAQIRKGAAAAPGQLQALATTSPWRASLEAAYSCNEPVSGTILNGDPAEILSCTQRLGGWPHVAVVSVVKNIVYYGDGVLPALPPMERAIGVLSGELNVRDAQAATVSTSDSILAQRLAAQAFSSGDIKNYNSLMSLGSKANQAEDFPAAVIAYRAALALQQGKLGANNAGALEPMLELALNLSDNAQYRESKSLFATAQKLLPRSPDPNAKPKYLHYLGLDQLNQDHYGSALSLLQQAQQAYAALLPPDLLTPQRATTTNDALINVSHDSASSGFLSEQTQLNSPVTQGALLGVIETLRYEAVCAHRLGKDSQSTKALQLSDDIASGNDITPPILGARLDRTAASVNASVGLEGQALAGYAAAASDFNAAIPGSRPVAETDLLQGSVFNLQKDNESALKSCRAGIALLEALKLGTSSALIAPCLQTFAMAADTAPNQANELHEEMFEAAELAQGSVTAREISEAAARLSTSSSDPKAAAAIRTQQDDAANLAKLYQARDSFTKGQGGNAGGATPGETLAGLDKQIVAANAALQQDDLAVQAAAPNFGQLVQQVVTAKDVLHALRPDEGFLGITTTPLQTWLFLLHGQSVTVARSTVNDAHIAHLVSAVRNSIEPTQAGLPAFDMADAYTIYKATLGPFAKDMPSIHELVVAPSGPLLSLPFALLPTGPADQTDLSHAPWLIRTTNLAYVPAAANFVSLRKIEATSAAHDPWFGFGDFQNVSLAQAQATYNPSACGESAAEFSGLPHLPYATLELKAAAAIFGANASDELTNNAFTVPQVEKANLKNYRILHFATHALLPTDLACQDEPAIVTSAPEGAKSAANALLTTSDVTNLHLDANLVVLSACNTGGGEEGGEALSGLARSFFYAGARALMVTQWSVNDQVSAFLVADTLSRLHAGASGGAAGSLRAAQISLIDSAGHGAPASLADPFFWAAFAVIGDGGAAPQTQITALSSTSRAAL